MKVAAFMPPNSPANADARGRAVPHMCRWVARAGYRER